MHIQVINFELNIPHEDYIAGATEAASVFAEMPGLISKHWLGDKENQIYGGVYVWESKEAFIAWTESDAFRKAHAQASAPKGTYLGHPELETFESVLEE